MATELSLLLERIGALLDCERGTPRRDALEHTLTDGYAHALALEGERLRIERQIAASMEGIRRGDLPAGLPALAERLAANERDLARLRPLLRTLHRRVESIGEARRERAFARA